MKNPEIDKFVEDKKQEFNLNVIKPIDELMKECITFGIKIGEKKIIKEIKDKSINNMRAAMIKRLENTDY